MNKSAASQPQREQILQQTASRVKGPGVPVLQLPSHSPRAPLALGPPRAPPACVPVAGDGMVPGGAWELRGRSLGGESQDVDPGLRRQAHRSLAFETLMLGTMHTEGQWLYASQRGPRPPHGWPRKPSPAEVHSCSRKAAFQERTCQWKSQASGKWESGMR